ncbi:MAG TPA: DJ-1/PfpI family protein [Acidimicrobiia bacterium]|nr:DJ-1/PfpI family protein [Acidimicrobiia bacterium]
MRIGLLLFDDVDLLDVGGPYEVFLTASRLAERDGHPAPFEVITIGDAPVTAYGGMGLVPTHRVGDVESLDVLIVPGAIAIDRVMGDPAIMDAAARLVGRADLTASVCTGAFVLGKLGMLAGIGWTTHFEDVQDLAALIGSDRGVVSPWVDEDSIVTAGGLSSGIAMALHLVERLAGRDLAVRTARQLQYAWDPKLREYVAVALAWFGDGGRDALHAYERRVQPLVEEHGGTVDLILEPSSVTGWDGLPPDEIHVLAFPDARAFDAYVSDPRRADLSSLRSEGVDRTIVLLGHRSRSF